MIKKQLYIPIAIFCIVLLYMLFRPQAVIQAPDEVDESELRENVESLDRGAETTPQNVQQADELLEDEQVTLEGTFVGLLEEIDRFDKTYQYLLLNDGSEILRVDLRPLIGYSGIDTIGKLGVERGDKVTIIGVMNDEAFSIESIE